MPPTPVRRIDAAEKARRLLSAPPAGCEGDRLAKLTTRVRAEQLSWLREEAARFRVRNPRAPRLTVEELTRVALEHLREAQDLDALVARYRS
jgi:hypothetical protein